MPSSSQEYQGLGIPATSSADWLGSYNRSRFLNNTESRVTTAAKINDLDGGLERCPNAISVCNSGGRKYSQKRAQHAVGGQVFVHLLGLFALPLPSCPQPPIDAGLALFSARSFSWLFLVISKSLFLTAPALFSFVLEFPHLCRYARRMSHCEAAAFALS